MQEGGGGGQSRLKGERARVRIEGGEEGGQRSYGWIFALRALLEGDCGM